MTNREIADHLTDTPLLVSAIQQAVRDARQRHKKLGNPIAEWRDGKVVWIAPEDIEDAEPTPPVDPAARVE